MYTRITTLWVGLGVALMAGSVGALPFGTTPGRVNLGEGVHADRVAAPCVYSTVYTTGCFAWVPEGFAMPPPGMGTRVNMLAVTGRGRIVAALEAGGVAYSDDRGAGWFRARMDGMMPSPRALSFDDRSDFGAAVGVGGTLWTTDDGGARWRVRRDGGLGGDLVDVAVAGQTVAMSDAVGGVWVSTNGGSSVRTLATRAQHAMPVMGVHQGAVWIGIEGGRWWRAGRDGSVERQERGPW